MEDLKDLFIGFWKEKLNKSIIFFFINWDLYENGVSVIKSLFCKWDICDIFS